MRGAKNRVVSGPEVVHVLAAVDSIGANLCVLDGDGLVLWVNEPWRHFAIANGGSVERCCEGANYLAACDHLTQDEAEVDAPFVNGLRDVITGRRATFEVDYPCHTPMAPRWFHLLARGYLTADGSRRTVLVHSDVTARHLAEQERALVARNLLQLQRLESHGTMTRHIAHEFNNVLTMLLGNLSLVRMQVSTDSPVVELLDDLDVAAGRCRELVAQLQRMSRARPTEPRSLVLAEVVHEVAALTRAAAPRTIEVRVACELVPPVLADRDQMHQLLQNLCSHGVHQMLGEPGTLTVALTHVDVDTAGAAAVPGVHPGPHACLEVHDTGRALDAATQQRLFEPFFTGTGGSPGSGLGLSVALAIVRSHGGGIDVRSSPEAGTTFRVLLPLRQAATVVLEPRAATTLPGHGRHVLLVHADPASASITARNLQRRGYHVVVRARAAEARATLVDPEHKVTAVVVDVPNTSGRAIDPVRALASHHPEVHFVLCCQPTSGHTTTLVDEPPNVQTLVHPVSTDQLAAAIEALRSPAPRA